MPQVRLVIPPGKHEGDVQRAPDGSLIEDDGLETVMTVSLGTDARASDDDGLPPGADRRGYWFDVYDDEDPTPIGSKLWLLDGHPVTSETIPRIEKYASDALAWMIAARVASRIEVTAEHTGPDEARLTAVIYRADDQRSPYQRTWELHFALE